MSRPEDNAACEADSNEERLSETAGVDAEGATVDAGSESADSAEPVDPMQKLQEDKDFYLQQLQVSRAELENYRRRTTADRFEQRKRVRKDLFLEILPLYDDLLLAMEASMSSEKSLQQGLQIIVDKFSTLLTDNKIESIDAVGEIFDPEWHEAMFHEVSENAKPGEILEIFERGYRYGDELLRPARVKVAKAPDS